MEQSLYTFDWGTGCGSVPYLSTDEAGKGPEDAGKEEQEDGFQIGSSYPGLGSSAAERVTGGMKQHGMDYLKM